MNVYVNGTLWHTGSNKDNLIGDIERMNLGGSWNGGVDYFGDVASFRMWNVALSGEVISNWMNHEDMASLEEHPMEEHLLGAINMSGPNGDPTNQGPLAGWIHGNPGRHSMSRERCFWMRRPVGRGQHW